jgi:DNA-binding LacI/PurR family transcriptional regulator
MSTRRRPTLRAIANALKISPGTVSRSLREYPGVHPEMRQRVRAMAESMGYVARRENDGRDRASAGAGKRTKLGVVVGDLVVLKGGAVDTSYVAYHFLAGLSQAASELDAVLSVAFLNASTLDESADPQREIGFLRDVEGVVLIYPLPEPFVARLVKQTNVVSLEHAYPTLAVDVVSPAQAVDVMRAVERLHQLGHRRIGYTADDAARGNRLPQTLRFAGYLSALRRGGLEYRAQDVLGMPGPAVPRGELAAAVAGRVRDGVTAVVCSTDRQAYLLLKELSAYKIQVPQQLSIIGIGGVTPIEGLSQLTMYRTPYETLGLAAIRRLQERRQQPESSPVVTEYPGSFIEGTSIAPPRASR